MPGVASLQSVTLGDFEVAFLPDGEELAPGVTARFTPGRTPGHISLVITAVRERRFLTGDTLHRRMQLTEPDWSVAFDADPAQARATREALYAELIQPYTLVAANHFSDSVFGRVSRAGARYAWTPEL